MRGLRRATSGLLRAAVARAPVATRPWGEAMLRELDFIESDRTAVLWALGGVTTMCRQAMNRVANSFRLLSRTKAFWVVLAGAAAVVALLTRLPGRTARTEPAYQYMRDLNRNIRSAVPARGHRAVHPATDHGT
ncbi:MAG TPA: hypothetical protein VMG41_07385 [Gemmatimonadales bacterium]|nr:hypothetical protein [Gemmatimonadales bacterium]